MISVCASQLSEELGRNVAVCSSAPTTRTRVSAILVVFRCCASRFKTSTWACTTTPQALTHHYGVGAWYCRQPARPPDHTQDCGYATALNTWGREEGREGVAPCYGWAQGILLHTGFHDSALRNKHASNPCIIQAPSDTQYDIQSAGAVQYSTVLSRV